MERNFEQNSVPESTGPLKIALSILAVLVVISIGYVFWYRAHLADNVLDAMRSGQYSRAVGFLETAVEEDSVDAMILLGNMNYLGLGTDTDAQTAADLYQRAGLRGSIDAQYNLALLYHSGIGVKQDNVSAAAWFLLADAGGNHRADQFLRTLTGQMNPNMIQQAYELQRELGEKIQAAQEQ